MPAGVVAVTGYSPEESPSGGASPPGRLCFGTKNVMCWPSADGTSLSCTFTGPERDGLFGQCEPSSCMSLGSETHGDAGPLGGIASAA